MTLTSLLPTLRESLPSPLDANAWPARAAATTTDIVIAGVSVLRIVELCATPCVHTDAAVVPFSRGAASPTASTTVVVASVTTVRPDGIELDATFDRHAPVWSEARLLGRVSHAYDAPLPVRAGGEVAGTATLPSDIRPGDLVAVPCPGCFSVGDVRVGAGR